jgi:hypothetical protein
MAEYLPMIHEPEYAGLRMIISSFPRFWSDWRKQHDERILERIRAVCVAPIVVDVSLAAYTAFCGGHDPIGLGLLRFAEETGRRQSAGASSDMHHWAAPSPIRSAR